MSDVSFHKLHLGIIFNSMWTLGFPNTPSLYKIDV